jgi:hypothetical protein
MPDVALGVGRSFRPGVGDASATRRLQTVYLDVEEKRNEKNEDECVPTPVHGSPIWCLTHIFLSAGASFWLS